MIKLSLMVHINKEFQDMSILDAHTATTNALKIDQPSDLHRHRNISDYDMVASNWEKHTGNQ